MVKETKKFDQERRVQSTRFAHFWSVPKGNIGCLLALAGRYKPPTRRPFLRLPSVIMRHLIQNSRADSSLALPRAYHSFTQAHLRVSKVQQKTCLLGEQRTRAPSILTLSWRIPDDPPRWKVVAKPRRCRDSWPPEKNSIRSQRWGLIAQSFCVIIFSLKYKRDRESFWHRHHKEAESVPPS